MVLVSVNYLEAVEGVYYGSLFIGVSHRICLEVEEALN